MIIFTLEKICLINYQPSGDTLYEQHFLYGFGNDTENIG